MVTKLSQNFTLDEMVESQTASRLMLDNTPPPEVLEQLHRTALCMEEVRALLGKPILVSSGYRSPKVNEAVGGVGTSAHCLGYAVDFICPGFGTPFQIAGKILASKIKYDQLIQEHTWIHISFDPRMRQQPLTLLPGGKYKAGISA